MANISSIPFCIPVSLIAESSGVYRQEKVSVEMDKSSIDKLLELQKLHESGVLTDKEFEEEKKRVLEEDKKLSEKPAEKTRNLYSDILNLWGKFHSQFRLDQKKQEELSTNKLSMFVWAINIVSFVGMLVLICNDSSSFRLRLNTMMILPLLLEASLLFWGIWKSNNKAMNWVMLFLMILPILGLFYVTDFITDPNHPIRGLEALMNKVYLASLLYAFISYLLIPNNGKVTFKIIKVLALATILNPVFYGIKMTGGVVETSSGEGYLTTLHSYVFNDEGLYWIIFLVIFWFASHLIYSILTGQSFGQSVISVLKGWNTVFHVIKRHKKICCAVVGLFIVYIIGNTIKHYNDERQAAIALQQKQKQDSIAEVRRREQERKNAIIRAEQARKAAIEEARRDSIDKAEHQWFVQKYAKVGIIFTYLQMTRGKNDDGTPTKGISFRIFNPTNKTIKYVVAHCYAINAVDDVMGYPHNCRGIGPVGSHEFGEWSFDDVFEDENDVIDDISVYFTVVYTNGSSKIVKWKNAYVDDFKESWFD